MNKRIIIILLICRTFLFDIQAFASETNEGTHFSVTVPMSLPIGVNSEGEVILSDSLYVRNNSDASIEISEIIIKPANDWTLVSLDENFFNKQVDLKEFGLGVFGADMATTQSFIPKVIQPLEESAIDYSAVIAPQTQDRSEVIANVVFVLNWHTSVLLYESDFDYIPEENEVVDLEEDAEIEEDTKVDSEDEYVEEGDILEELDEEIAESEDVEEEDSEEIEESDEEIIEEIEENLQEN